MTESRTKTDDVRQLLRAYARDGSEAAFTEIVSRFVNLVYSTAARVVNNDPQLAEDVTQTVFADLAAKAGSLPEDVMVGGWLHRHACFVAANVMRGERRRRVREEKSMEMNDYLKSGEDHSAVNLAALRPVLDEAIDQLPGEDRTAILLRFFEQRDFRSVGEFLGSTEEAARKRVDRALQKLSGMLKRKGVVLSVSALGATLASQAVTAAPAGLALTVSGAVFSGAAAGATAIETIQTFTIIMTKAKAAFIAILIAAGIAIPIMQQRTAHHLEQENAQLRQQVQSDQKLVEENSRLKTLLARQQAAPVRPSPGTNEQYRELLKLRGEVGALKKEVASSAEPKPPGPSALSDLTTNPEMRKGMRDQQKMALSMVYKSFSQKLNLSKEQGEKFNDLLGDNVMENIDHIMTVLREGKSPSEMEGLFAGQEAALRLKVQELLGPEAAAQYQDYTRELLPRITAEQFKQMMTGGEKEARDAQAQKLQNLVQEESRAALASSGLSPDYQLVPMLNFRNIASEEQGERSVKMLDEIYAKAAARADFLSPDDAKKFEEFRSKALANNRMALTLNRKLMAPAPGK